MAVFPSQQSPCMRQGFKTRPSDCSGNKRRGTTVSSVLSSWKVETVEPELALQLIVDLDDAKKVHANKSRPHRDIPWLSILARPARAFGKATGATKEQLRRLITFGQRRCSNFLCSPKRQPAPLFGLCNISNLFTTFPSQKKQDFENDDRIRFLRQWAGMICKPSFLQDAIIEFATGEYDRMKYMYVLPGNKKRKHGAPEFLGDSIIWAANVGDDEDDAEMASRRRTKFAKLPGGPMDKNRKWYPEFFFFCGVPGIAAIYIPVCRIEKAESLDVTFDRHDNDIGLSDLSSILKLESGVTALRMVRLLCDPHYREMQRVRNPEYYSALDLLVSFDRIFSTMPGARVNLGVTSQPLSNAAWSKSTVPIPSVRGVPLQKIFSCIIYHETGYLDLNPETLIDALAVSSHNSIYVASQLLMDPEQDLPDIPVRRIIGNMGKPGLSILVPPINPKIIQNDLKSWKVVAHERFDGKIQDSFSATSLHISLTGYELDIDQAGVRGNQDHDAKIVETAISLHSYGEWIADLDIIKASKTWTKATQRNDCTHEGNARRKASQVQPLVSVDTWLELLDQPLVNCIVRANGNYIARLAAASLASQKLYDIRIISSETCWACVAAETNPHSFTTFNSRKAQGGYYDFDPMEESDAEEWGEGQSPITSSLEPEDSDFPTTFLQKDQGSQTRLVFIC